MINDFECLTSLSCAYKKVPRVNFGHQASFVSPKVPRPEKQGPHGSMDPPELCPRHPIYRAAHFKQYDDFILPPVIKKEILQAEPQDKGYITVYLSSYSDATVRQYLQPLKEFRWQVFSKEVKQPVQDGNILFIPVSKGAFNKSLINCSAILTGAGF